jgi:hypothetical protein
MYIEKYGMMTQKNGDIQKEGFVKESHDGHTKTHKLSDEELKVLFGNIRLNTGFSLPDQLIQDFVNDGSMIPTFKRCMHFNKTDFKNIVEPLKARQNRRKKLPKRNTQHKKKNKKTRTQKGKTQKAMTKK